MAKKLTSVLGIDIGSRTIKIAEIKNNGREPMVTALGMTDTPPGAVDHTGIFNPDAVGIALKKLISESGVSVGDVVVSVAGQASVMVRTFEVPRMNDAELAEHMQWEVSRSTPFAESTVVNDFRPLRDDDPNSANIDVVMAISPQSAIDTVLACIKKAGKKVSGIDVQPLGLARTLAISYDDIPHSETLCLVDIGHKTTAINVYRNGKLLLPRQVPIGGEMFTQAIADALTISFDEAERLKVTEVEIPANAGVAGPSSNPFAAPEADTTSYFNPFADPADVVAAPSEPTGGFNPFDTDAPSEETSAPLAVEPVSAVPVAQENHEAMRVYNAMSGVLMEFLDEVRRSIDFFRSRGGSIDRVLLSGGGAKLNGINEFLSNSLGLPCDSYDALRRLNINVRKVTPGFIDEHRQQFSIAVGNGLYIFFD